jgi:hypothetical protein
MSNKQLRTIIRAVHLCASVLILGFVYAAPLRQTESFVMLLQFVVIPMVAVSGIAMWQQAALTKLRRNRSNRKAHA